MYNFLLIDDYEGEIDSFKDTIEVLNKKKGEIFYNLDIADSFTSGMEKINETFDGIIVDIQLDNNKSGNEIIDEIMKKTRVPVVVYTATPDVRDDLESIVKVFKKSEISQEEIINYLCNILDTGLFNVIGRMGIIEQKMTEIFWENLYPLRELWMNYKSMDINTEKVLLRYALANIQEHFDITDNDTEMSENIYLTEEMYIKYINTVDSVNRVQTGAIVKGKDENEKYFIILSPPCDLALHKGKFKSDRILLCEIDSYDDLNKNLISKATNSKDKQKRIEEIIQNNRTRYYHWLPRNILFEGGFINFRKVSSYSQEDFNEKFMEPKLKVQEAFVKNILNRFSSFYGRQGQPDFDFTNELKTNKDIFRKL